MPDSDQPHINVVKLEYVDYANYYMVYGIATMIVFLLLLWSFVRNDPSEYSHSCGGRHGGRRLKYSLEGMESPYTDANYKYGPLQKGTYGDVTVYFNETPDNQFADQWQTEHGGLYLHNSKTYWRDVNTPDESDFWNKSGDPILGVPEKWQKIHTPVRDIVKW